MRVILALAGTAGVLLAGLIVAFFSLVAMTGLDLRIRVNMVAYLACMGTIAVLVIAGISVVWWLALR